MRFTFILVYSFSPACNCTINASNYRQALNIAEDLVATGATVTIGIEYNSIVHACCDWSNFPRFVYMLTTANIPPAIALESIRQVSCHMAILANEYEFTDQGEIA